MDPLKIPIEDGVFHCYVSLPEGIWSFREDFESIFGKMSLWELWQDKMEEAWDEATEARSGFSGCEKIGSRGSSWSTTETI